MLVACYAYEGIYQGLHGIETRAVIKVSDNIKEAQKEVDEWGREESEELIYRYGLESEYYDEEDEDYDIADSCYYENRGWYGYKIKDTSLSEEELDNKLFSLGMNLFVEKYCDKEISF